MPSRPRWLWLLAALLMLIAAGSATPDLAIAQDDNPIERDLARYWSGKREMPVIKGDKLYITAERLELALYGGIIPNDDFFNYFPIGMRATYSFDGIWGIELSGSYSGLASNSELTDFLVESGEGIRKDVDLGDTQLGRVGVYGVFSPLYGKWSFQTYKISHFDLFIVAGMGAVFTEAPDIQTTGSVSEPADEPVSRIAFEGSFGVGFRFFLADWVSMRIDGRWFIYPAFDSGVEVPAEVTLGFGFFPF